jgi:hypothetical protein
LDTLLSTLNTRDQAVQTSFDAQGIAADQQKNLETMNASLQARYYQVFASLSKVIRDPSLTASGGLINDDILARQEDFEQTLQLYMTNDELATSDNMSAIRTILLNDYPNTGPMIIHDQQSALNAVSAPNGLWSTYRSLQNAELIQLQHLIDNPLVDPTALRMQYDQLYYTLWKANYQFTLLRNSWHQVVDAAVSTGKTVSTAGRSQTSPVCVTITFTYLILLNYAGIWSFMSFQSKRAFPFHGEGKSSGNAPIPPSGSILPIPQLP